MCFFIANGYQNGFSGTGASIKEAKQHALFNFIDYYSKDSLPPIDSNMQVNAYELLNAICLAYSCMYVKINNDVYTLNVFKKETEGWKDTIIIEGCEYAFSANDQTFDESKQKALTKLINYYIHKE